MAIVGVGTMNPMFFLLAILYSMAECAYIEENGYRGVTISFSENVLDGSFDVKKLKDVLTSASEYLYHATRRRSYFEEFILVVPPSWDENDVCEGGTITEAPKYVDIYVTGSSGIPDLKAQHSKGCGEKGDIMYLPKSWLEGNTKDIAYQFVQQWSVFRYGVFSENPENPGSCIAVSDSVWSPVGCYNVEVNAKVQFNANGLPQCYFPGDWTDELKSSVMFSANSSKALDFCDESESFPHNPVAPTLHNRLCDGNPVWKIIKQTEDFRYGRNLPRKEASLPNTPTFRCFKESKTHLTIMVQDTNSQARSEIRYSLYYFLSIIDPNKFSVSFATFSSRNRTNYDDVTILNLEDAMTVKQTLDSKLQLIADEPSVCLTCGLEKAYKVSNESQHSLRTIILLARESSLENAKTSELIEIIQSDSDAIIYLLFLQDTASDKVPSSLEDALQYSRGRLFRLKNDPVFMLTEFTVALLDASKNILHVEDKFLVVHKKSHLNITKNFTDVVLTPKNVRGKLFYTMQCKKRGVIKCLNESCLDKDPELPSPVFGDDQDLKDNQDSIKVWRYFFHYKGSNEGTTCASLALLKLESLSKNSITIKGWLNANEITPGQNVPIIYAEVYGGSKQYVRVEARIIGPGMQEFELELRDNGNGDPDTVKNDNIYSRYFMSFSQKGTYTVSIFVTALVPENTYLLFAENNKQTDLKLTQTKVIGTFRVTQPLPAEDIFPPNRVCDLTVTSIDSTNRMVSLQWTAPGDNYDEGKAKKYIIKLSHQWTTLIDSTFNFNENVLLEVNEFQPASSGEPENVTIQCPYSNYNATYYIALQAVDIKDNKAKTSNIIQIHFKEASSFSSTDPGEIFPTTTSFDVSDASTDFTKVLPDNVTLPDTTTVTVDETTIAVTTNSSKDEIVITKRIFIIVVSSISVFVLVVLILNIVICYCCFRKKNSNKSKKLTRESSMRPPYNLNISYHHGSEISLDEGRGRSSSSTSLVDPTNTTYSTVKKEPQERRYTYHTDRSLKNKMESENRRNDLGFKLVEPMPAYATSSLSRFTKKNAEDENRSGSPRTRHNIMQLQKMSNKDETQVYPLGEV